MAESSILTSELPRGVQSGFESSYRRGTIVRTVPRDVRGFAHRAGFASRHTHRWRMSGGAHDSLVIHVEITNRQSLIAADGGRLRLAVKHVLDSKDVVDAEISLAVVDDDTIRRLHSRFLGVDEPTDVLSFPLTSGGEALEGEIIASAETAARRAREFGWRDEDELLLYIVHGALHLVGYDDSTPEARTAMRAAEGDCLANFGLKPQYDAAASLEAGDVKSNLLQGGIRTP